MLAGVDRPLLRGLGRSLTLSSRPSYRPTGAYALRSALESRAKLVLEREKRRQLAFKARKERRALDEAELVRKSSPAQNRALIRLPLSAIACRLPPDPTPFLQKMHVRPSSTFVPCPLLGARVVVSLAGRSASRRDAQEAPIDARSRVLSQRVRSRPSGFVERQQRPTACHRCLRFGQACGVERSRMGGAALLICRRPRRYRRVRRADALGDAPCRQHRGHLRRVRCASHCGTHTHITRISLPSKESPDDRFLSFYLFRGHAPSGVHHVFTSCSSRLSSLVSRLSSLVVVECCALHARSCESRRTRNGSWRSKSAP